MAQIGGPQGLGNYLPPQSNSSNSSKDLGKLEVSMRRFERALEANRSIPELETVMRDFQVWRNNNPNEYNKCNGDKVEQTLSTWVQTMTVGDPDLRLRLQSNLVSEPPDRKLHSNSHELKELRRAVSSFKQEPSEKTISELVDRVLTWKTSREGEFDKRGGNALMRAVFNYVDTYCEKEGDFKQQMFHDVYAKCSPYQGDHMTPEHRAVLEAFPDCSLPFLPATFPMLKPEFVESGSDPNEFKDFFTAIDDLNSVDITDAQQLAEKTANIIEAVVPAVVTSIDWRHPDNPYLSDFGKKELETWINACLKPLIVQAFPRKLEAAQNHLLSIMYSAASRMKVPSATTVLNTLLDRFGFEGEINDYPRVSAYRACKSSEERFIFIKNIQKSCGLPTPQDVQIGFNIFSASEAS